MTEGDRQQQRATPQLRPRPERLWAVSLPAFSTARAGHGPPGAWCAGPRRPSRDRLARGRGHALHVPLHAAAAALLRDVARGARGRGAEHLVAAGAGKGHADAERRHGPRRRHALLREGAEAVVAGLGGAVEGAEATSTNRCSGAAAVLLECRSAEAPAPAGAEKPATARRASSPSAATAASAGSRAGAPRSCSAAQGRPQKPTRTSSPGMLGAHAMLVGAACLRCCGGDAGVLAGLGGTGKGAQGHLQEALQGCCRLVGELELRG
eukprot:CAMPEP_0168378472 /NCGR_PEP_ID=MMETSP0228-20121227/11354_1 /TAXON_ID=133427 /ORGANISM="Protoceratium reticulatum, Strain CCCM 535 (=CCMP 1889)" /LENGTH=265 /DNA_ID=CAMNT_0008391491 /DNA_START=45 /DNA_END=840 /DNA_ORIENTATION=+